MTHAPVSVAASITAAGEKRFAYDKHVGEHETAFGVGVDDLDELAVRRLHDVARLHRFARRHVRRRADETHDVDRKFHAADRFHRAEHAGGAAHVELHPLHALRRLDRDAAGVEAEAFADERDRLGASAPPFVLERDELGILRRSLRDAEERSHLLGLPSPRDRAP